MDKLLRIDMGSEVGPQASEEPLGDYAGLGGRAMTSAIVAKEVPPLCHPLGKNNKLVIAPGLLSGSHAAQSGRISVGCKSPLTGGIKEANAGGQEPRYRPGWVTPLLCLRANPMMIPFTRWSSTKTV